MKKIKVILFTVLSLLAGASTGLSQGWEQSYGAQGDDSFRSVILADNGDILLGGTSYDATANRDGQWVARLNPAGELIWQQNWVDSATDLSGRKLIALPNAQFLLLGIVQSNGAGSSVSGWILDAGGNTLTQWILPAIASDLKDALLLPDGQVALVGARLLMDSMGIETQDAVITILDPMTAQVDWKRSYNAGNTDIANAITLVNDQLVVAGYSIQPNQGGFNTLLLSYSLTGELLIEQIYGNEFPELATDILLHNDQLLLLGQTETFDTASDDLFIMTCSLAGDSLSFDIYNNPGQDFPRSFAATSTGELYATGDTRLESNLDRNLVVWKIDAAGNLIWTKNYGGFGDDLGYDLLLNSTELPIIAGYTESFGNGLSDGYVIALDSLGQTYTAAVAGQVSWDKDLDCAISGADASLANWIVLAESDSLARATTTDAMGNYTLLLPNGEYQVKLSPPNSYWSACVDSVLLNITTPLQQEEVNFSVQADVECPLLYVDVSTPFLRRCFQNQYSIVVENRGTLAADPATLTLTLDEFLNVDSFSISPISQSGNIYEFDLGNLNPWEPIQFFMWVTVDCDNTVLGQTHCVTAEVFPDSLCLPLSPEWNQSSLTVGATCEQGMIEFTIRNVGSGGTDGPQGIVIIEDDILLLTLDSVNLDPGEDTTIVIGDPQGATYRLEVEQSVGHPGNSHPSATVEGCGGSPSTGYVIIFPQDDGNPFVDIDCRENQGSYDPNDKQGFPIGYSDRHFMEADTDLEYLIRFQNTGTDVAFRVELRDTLSPLLDLTTLRMGSASHAMQWSLRDRELMIEFDNINLPDSASNLLESQGWVEFKIKPIASIDTGSVIYNRAGIYFDFNEPVITNATYHEIGENFVIIDLLDHTVEGAKIEGSLRVFPNPFQSHTDFKMSAIAAAPTELLIYSIDGRLLMRCPVVNQEVKLQPDHWPSGIYIYRWQSENELLETGKIILQR